MSLETYCIPAELIEAAVRIPEGQFGAGEHEGATEHLESLNLQALNIKNNQPFVLTLCSEWIKYFEESFSRDTPLRLLQPNEQPVDRFELLQLAVATAIGTPLSMPDIRKGAIVQDIFPMEKSRFVASSSYGSEVDFEFHNDLSFLEDKEIPDYFMLGCIRNIERAPTSVVGVQRILKALSHDQNLELRKVAYSMRHTYRRGSQNELERTKNSSIILPNNEVRLGVDMVPLSKEADLAINSLRALLKEIAVPQQLKAGEILIVPNRFSVHSRGSFVALSNKSKRRWLQRINIKKRNSDN